MPALPSSLISSLSCAPALTVPETAGGLPAVLAGLPDPRARRGVRHQVAVVATAAVCAVVAGYRSYTAIAEWVADAPDTTALALGMTPDRRPSEAMIRRLLQAMDPQLLTTAISVWLASRATSGTSSGRRAIAVDGKALRGSRTTDTAARHVLAACDQASGVVLGSTNVDGKTNEVRREALCRIPNPVRRNPEESSWARWLTRSRKAMGTRACHEYRRPCPVARDGASGGPRDMAKAGLPEPQSPAMQVFIHRKWLLKPVPRSVPVYFVGGCILRSVGRCPVRVFKGMSGAPKSRCYVRQRRTRDRLRGASPMATERP